MLNRCNAPNMGLWNGIGGHIEVDENPTDCILREVAEETGMQITTEDLDYHGWVRWLCASCEEGMHVFTTWIPKSINYQTPRYFSEGILDWKPIYWILDPKNKGVVSNLPYYLPTILNDPSLYEHIFVYTNDQINQYGRKPLQYRKSILEETMICK